MHIHLGQGSKFVLRWYETGYRYITIRHKFKLFLYHKLTYNWTLIRHILCTYRLKVLRYDFGSISLSPSSLTRFLSWCLDFLFSLSRPSRRVPPVFPGRPLIRWLFPPMMPRQLSEPHLQTCCKYGKKMKHKTSSELWEKKSLICLKKNSFKVLKNWGGQKYFLMPHLLFRIEWMEVVVVGELSAAGDLLESKETNSVHSVHWPERKTT